MKNEDEILDIELTDKQISDLRQLRGNCSCHINPPCSYCSDPITVGEAIELGIIGENNAIYKK